MPKASCNNVRGERPRIIDYIELRESDLRKTYRQFPFASEMYVVTSGEHWKHIIGLGRTPNDARGNRH